MWVTFIKPHSRGRGENWKVEKESYFWRFAAKYDRMWVLGNKTQTTHTESKGVQWLVCVFVYENVCLLIHCGPSLLMKFFPSDISTQYMRSTFWTVSKFLVHHLFFNLKIRTVVTVVLGSAPFCDCEGCLLLQLPPTVQRLICNFKLYVGVSVRAKCCLPLRASHRMNCPPGQTAASLQPQVQVMCWQNNNRWRIFF